MKKNRIVIFITCSVLILSIFINSVDFVKANAKSYEIETWTTTAGCRDYGYVDWTAKVSYNVNTGKYILKSVSYKTSFKYTFYTLSSYTTNPKINKEINSSDWLKITFTVKGLGNSSDFTAKLQPQ